MNEERCRFCGEIIEDYDKDLDYNYCSNCGSIVEDIEDIEKLLNKRIG